jgi:two-component system LytT family response regulator
MIVAQDKNEIDHLKAQIQTLHEDLNICRHSLEELLARQTSNQKSIYLKKILAKSNKSLVIVQTLDIDWIEAWGDYVRLHCIGKVYTIHQKIGDLEKRLDPQQFVRIGRSAIINVERIKQLEPLNHGDYLIKMHDSTELNLSRNYRGCLTDLFNDHC